MTVTIPESVTAEGNVVALWVPAIATPTAPSIATDLAGKVDISCFLMPDWDGAQPTQNQGESRRFCSRQTFSRLGRVQWAISPLSYTYLPQELGTPGHAANEVYEALAQGNTGFVMLGYGIEPGATPAAGDVFDVFPAECGVQGKAARGADEFAPLTVTQTLGVTGVPNLDVKLVA